MQSIFKEKKEMEFVEIGNELYFKISNSDALRAFFMSIVSDSDHWMFVSSNGGLTAGRKNTEYALFPYYTDDKIAESTEITGSKTIFRVRKAGTENLWEPFSDRMEGLYRLTRNLYKSIYGNKILFEEVNHDLGLSFRYEWSSSDVYGFVRNCTLINHSYDQVNISVLDGIQNILPYGVGSDLQNRQSNLVDAYKRSELLKDSGLGIYALSAIIVDKAEPSEALKANTVWSFGLEDGKRLLSSLQLSNFRNGVAIQPEYDIKAEKGAYFIQSEIDLKPKEEKEWMFVANVNQNHSSIIRIAKQIQQDENLSKQVKQDIEKGTQNLVQLVAASDGLQMSQDELRDTRHFSNTLFNIMRGGIFDDNYVIEKWDFSNYLSKANKAIYEDSKEIIQKLPDSFSIATINEIADGSGDADFKRLCVEYMPLKFSRRHGDPSRPWNRFSINLRDEDGSKILDYEGNWRDIYQNWEALAHSYPEYVDGMIFKFLNASTFDGYNPYRITKDGFDWEIIEPDDPWSYIGYWGDHQIIYLLKFLEFLENHKPGKLECYFDESVFVYADVPYRIKSYQDVLKNPKDTIDFDHDTDAKIRNKRDEIGADGALLCDSNDTIHRVNFIEKILATVLSKLSNFIPEAGIWMNTQRPEWNDANNALVGNGVSMVTLYYLRRFLKFFQQVLGTSSFTEVKISSELAKFFNDISETFHKHGSKLSEKIDDKLRKQIMDALGQSGSEYRLRIYTNQFSGEKEFVSREALNQFVGLSLQFLEHSIECNKRNDGMYHAYNLMHVENDHEVSIAHLSEMLEGQVAVLSSGYLNSRQAVQVLDGLKASNLFRPDQYSYLLYPEKELPLFMEKNKIPKDSLESIGLFQQLLTDGNLLIVEKDITGDVHFNGNFKNGKDLENALARLSETKYAEQLADDKEKVLQVFEDIFDHKSFTGRSGTFYGYEGLGSIYWHMVSKLLLAVQECCLKAIEEGENEEIVGRLLEHFYEIDEGIGVHKSPSLYGAFPTDPYSHTPKGKGAQQPGMTGQVKEDILSRFGELGVFVKEKRLYFNPCLLRKEEFLTVPKTFGYVHINSEQRTIELKKDSLCFTYCQTPIVYKISDEEGLEVVQEDSSSLFFKDLWLDESTSKKIFERTGEISLINVNISEKKLR
ncbi:hypothetical protein [Flagellimonas nanhaiensis]|uniref:Cellobiose phosphorylase n=1 Tax=Flagellimonas nanhaiensis TaxID=2292706 RepID=A0A371JTM7_9FLAO|nr:hypothetical protein [Allomuricauda nanhaiensis]RDY61148.1 hypothetical protein DX873_02975 [Allomuricauda nanhaiensis]